MRTFLGKFLLYALPLVGMVLALELLLRHIPSDYSYKSTYWKEQVQEATFVIMGSSHAYYGIDPSAFRSKGFNAAHVSQSIDLDRMVLERYGERLERCRWLIIPVSYGTLFGRMDQGAEAWRSTYYSIHYDLDVPWSLSARSEIMHGTFESHIERLIAYHFKGKHDLRCSELGYGTSPPRATGDLETTGAEAASRHTTTDRSLLGENLLELDAMIQWAEDHGMDVLLCTTPVHHAYRTHMDPVQWGITRAALVQRTKQPHVRYVDLLDDGRFLDHHFRDADHLAQEGASLVGSILDSVMYASGIPGSNVIDR
jgi:hypothetical protein